MAGRTEVFLEIGPKRVFACALDWPGWCRVGKDEELALEALAAYLRRYAAVVKEAGLAPPPDAFEVVERKPGDATTDYGVPGKVAEADGRPLDARAAKRMAGLVGAAWTVFDRVVAASPAELRKGPRGGGRDRDKMVDHVLGAEASYARMLGLKHQQPALDDRRAILANREALLAALAERSDGSPRAPKGRPPRYAARRIAWHVLDHAWEMEDRRQ
jgi:hypothetical protein